MDFRNLTWRFWPGFFTARGWLCPACWSKISEFAYPTQETDCFVDGALLFEKSDGLFTRVKFSSKGGECPGEGVKCSLCHADLPGGVAEEVNFSVDV